MKPKLHFLICLNQRPEGHPRGSCSALGAKPLYDAFRAELEQRGTYDILATATGCMGPCDQGPTVVVYPEGVWYGKVQPADVKELIDSHLNQTGPVKRLMLQEA